MLYAAAQHPEVRDRLHRTLRFHGRPSYATTAVAALKKDSIKSTHIKNGQVKSGDLRDGDVRSVDLRDGDVGLVDLSDPAKASCSPSSTGR